MSSPKPPKKSREQAALEQAQLASYNEQIAESKAAIAARKAEIRRGSIGRRSLITTSETGVIPTTT